MALGSRMANSVLAVNIVLSMSRSCDMKNGVPKK